ncbi:MAG: DUF1801 domain-containing protein [Caulobacteraceae bacterium]|nr:MAG: DUF1801 domain-containing protein [Caulobacteraceae bacterium]
MDSFRAGLDPADLATVDALRTLITAAGPHLTERLKWNAPSFAVGDDDRITLGLERKGGVRVVLHRGAKVKDAAGFAFDDPTSLAKWPAADRGVVVFADAAAVEASADRLSDLCTRWLEATA